MARLFPLLAALLLIGCTVPYPAPPDDPTVVRCLERFERLDAAAGVSPSSPRRVGGFPYLRVDRFLASYRDQPLSPGQFEAWWWRLADADRQARIIEQGGAPAGLDRCYRVLWVHDRGKPGRQRLIRANAGVPSDYLRAAKVFGLYPLTGPAVGIGVAAYQAEQRERFATPLGELPVRGELVRFRPPEIPPNPPFSKGGIERAGLFAPPFSKGEIERAGLFDPPLSKGGNSRSEWGDFDALGIPDPTPGQLAALFARHAPVWEIDIAGDHDRPGRPVWRADGTPGVNPSEPLVYRYAGFTRWRGEALLQLNYLIWFDQRPLDGPFDILGGALDGLLWRVTLAADGGPLLYDSIHPCGCYHLLFPTPALALREDATTLPEPPLVPQSAPLPGAGERIVLRIASGTHYLERVYADAPSGEPHGWRDYAALYRTPVAGGGSRSLFRPDGIVPGSERAERILLWPMGVPEPGAMRERGRHAIAFIGERHFDDADLLERFFRPVE